MKVKLLVVEKKNGKKIKSLIFREYVYHYGKPMFHTTMDDIHWMSPIYPELFKRGYPYGYP